MIGELFRALPAATGPGGSKETPLHLIVDNYGTHNQYKVRRGWRSTRGSPCTSRRHLGNLVELRELTEKRVRALADVESVPELIAAIKEYLSNADPKPFVWMPPLRRSSPALTL